MSWTKSSTSHNLKVGIVYKRNSWFMFLDKTTGDSLVHVQLWVNYHFEVYAHGSGRINRQFFVCPFSGVLMPGHGPCLSECKISWYNWLVSQSSQNNVVSLVQFSSFLLFANRILLLQFQPSSLRPFTLERCLILNAYCGHPIAVTMARAWSTTRRFCRTCCSALALLSKDSHSFSWLWRTSVANAMVPKMTGTTWAHSDRKPLPLLHCRASAGKAPTPL